jgi:hypothetical protein
MGNIGGGDVLSWRVDNLWMVDGGWREVLLACGWIRCEVLWHMGFVRMGMEWGWVWGIYHGVSEREMEHVRPNN